MSGRVAKSSAMKSNKLPFEGYDPIPPDRSNEPGDVSVERLSGELKEITALYNIGVALNSSLKPKDISTIETILCRKL
jgi:hypothetical protein